MREGGQIFTFDMLLALILVMLIVTTSGLAISMARKRASGYVSRYSLERTASDAADVLVRSPGKPRDWADEIGELKIPGLAETKDNSDESVPNLVDSEKIGQLVRITTWEYWDPSKPEVQAVMKLFGGTNNFEVVITRGNKSLWHFWPGWDEENSSGAENSLVVATASRVIYTHPGDIVYKSEPVARENKPGAGTAFKKDNFLIYEGEVETYDWYAVIEISSREENRPKWVEVTINKTEKDRWKNISQQGDQTRKVIPSSPGWTNIVPGTNEVKIRVKAYSDDSIQWARVYIVGIPQGSDPERAILSIEKVPVNLTIKIWR